MTTRAPSGWRRARIQDLGEVLAGRQRSPNQPGTPRPYLRVANVFDGYIDTSDVLEMPFTDREFERFRLLPGDVLVNEGQSRHLVGRSAVYRGDPPECCFQNTIIRFRATAVADSEFAYQLFAWLQRVGRFSEIATQTTSIAHLGVNRFAQLAVDVPEVREQREIAAMLKAVDDAVAAGEAVVEQHERVRHDLMAHLLLGPDAAAWQAISLGDAGEWLSGGTPNKSVPELWTGPIPWVSPKDMKRARIGEAEDHVSEDAAANGTRLVPPGTLLMVVRGMILAHTFPVALTTAQVAFNQDIKALRPRDGLHPDYLLYWLTAMQPEVLKIVDVANHGTKRIATERLHELSLPVPSVEVQHRIVSTLRAADVRLDAEVAAVTERRRVKAALADALLSGRLRVRDAA